MLRVLDCHSQTLCVQIPDQTALSFAGVQRRGNNSREKNSSATVSTWKLHFNLVLWRAKVHFCSFVICWPWDYVRLGLDCITLFLFYCKVIVDERSGCSQTLCQWFGTFLGVHLNVELLVQHFNPRSSLSLDTQIGRYREGTRLQLTLSLVKSSIYFWYPKLKEDLK